MIMNNKVVLVTGSSRGIGKATIIKFASEGYNVVINYIESDKEAQEVKEFVEKEYNIKALTIKTDVSDEADVKSMVDTIIKEFGKIDVLVNNAGIVFDRNFEDITIEEFKRTLEVNVIGAFIVSREVSKHMKSGSTIVNVSSTNGTKTISPECLDYNVSKVGLQSLTRDLAFQLKPNIRVNAVAIGWADTDMNKDLPKEYIEDENAKIYLERFAQPEEIAKAIYFLASEESSYINSEILVIDGGY
ncbi:MAG: SDR family oxidoreductase [Bacilli bacterium]|nr:SDR family oxidoreductase [Bacilli bacterium]